jgi:hypothetical protein
VNDLEQTKVQSAATALSEKDVSNLTKSIREDLRSLYRDRRVEDKKLFIGWKGPKAKCSINDATKSFGKEDN